VIRAVLWDLDGTLVDSGDYHWQAWKSTLAAEGVALTYEQFLASFGQRNDRILRNWLGDDVDAARIRRIGDDKEAEYRRLAKAGGLVALPGAAEWVVTLHERGWKQAIASSAPRANVDVMLAALSLDRYFDAVVSAEDVTRGKPDPDVFLEAAEKLGATAAQSIVVEDAAAGIEAARRAGMRSIGVGASRLGAHVYVRSLTALAPDAFESLIANP
jgi:beta-phosphoglucomutase